MELPDRPGERRGASISVLVGQSDTIRRIPVTEEQILGLMKDGVQVLDLLRKEREADSG